MALQVLGLQEQQGLAEAHNSQMADEGFLGGSLVCPADIEVAGA